MRLRQFPRDADFFTPTALHRKMLNPVERASGQPENPFAALIPNQHISIVPSFTLESGVELKNVPVAYTTRGTLSANGDNALIVCHALSGSADVADWWGPLIGKSGRALDTTRFFIICLNSLGSPYGSGSPVTYKHGDPSEGRYGPDFPPITIRDDVNIHRIVLDDLGVRQIAAAVGGSMGGMLVLEYAYLGPEYVRAIVPIATSSGHSAWGISWGEAQLQSIYSDPKYKNGDYSFDDPPSAGLGAARMSALLTYRSRDSFESRFGRNVADPLLRRGVNDSPGGPVPSSNEYWAVHNNGHKKAGAPRAADNAMGNLSPPTTPVSRSAMNGSLTQLTDPQFHGATPLSPPTPSTPLSDQRRATTYFSAQSYLRYQGEKFVKRFDSNCYIALTNKLDTHDVSRDRVSSNILDPRLRVSDALSQIQQPALVLGIQSDGLFTFAEQQEIAKGIPNSRLKQIESPEGHDAFLLQFEQVNCHILEFFNEVLPDIMTAPEADVNDLDNDGTKDDAPTAKTSIFGEAEAGDLTEW